MSSGRFLGGQRLLQGLCTPLVGKTAHFPKPLRIHPIQLFSHPACWQTAGLEPASHRPRLGSLTSTRTSKAFGTHGTLGGVLIRSGQHCKVFIPCRFSKGLDFKPEDEVNVEAAGLIKDFQPHPSQSDIGVRVQQTLSSVLPGRAHGPWLQGGSGTSIGGGRGWGGRRGDAGAGTEPPRVCQALGAGSGLAVAEQRWGRGMWRLGRHLSSWKCRPPGTAEESSPRHLGFPRGEAAAAQLGLPRRPLRSSLGGGKELHRAISLFPQTSLAVTRRSQEPRPAAARCASSQEPPREAGSTAARAMAASGSEALLRFRLLR